MDLWPNFLTQSVKQPNPTQNFENRTSGARTNLKVAGHTSGENCQNFFCRALHFLAVQFCTIGHFGDGQYSLVSFVFSAILRG